jgi:hypothetical protein
MSPFFRVTIHGLSRRGIPPPGASTSRQAPDGPGSGSALRLAMRWPRMGRRPPASTQLRRTMHERAGLVKRDQRSPGETAGRSRRPHQSGTRPIPP